MFFLKRMFVPPPSISGFSFFFKKLITSFFDLAILKSVAITSTPKLLNGFRDILLDLCNF